MTTPEDLFSLRGRVAVVTGASSGIGESFARVLAAAGANVVVAARREGRIAALAESLGEVAAHFTCDVTDQEQVVSLMDFAMRRFGALDVVVNNAGVADPRPALEEPVERFREVVETNLVSVFSACQAAGRRMAEAGSGSIVNVASILGLVASGRIPQASYTASKAGVVNLTRELAAQWAGRGIRVNAIAPGWFPTEMTSVMFEEGKGLAFIERNTPMRRGGRLEELSGALLLLASDAGSYITGQTLVVDGGWTLA